MEKDRPKTPADRIREASKGKPSCGKCNGKGMYDFEGTSIFCVQCHGEEGCTTLWTMIDAYLA